MIKMTSTMRTTPKMKKCNIDVCIVYYLKKLLTTPHLDSYGTIDPNSQILSYLLSELEIELDVMKEMYAAFIAHVYRIYDIF